MDVLEAGAVKAGTGLVEAEVAALRRVGVVANSANEFVVLGTKLGNDQATLNAAKWIKPVDGFYDVVIHGTQDSFAVLRGEQWVYLDQRSLASYVSRQADYEGSAIRLVSCSTGCLDLGAAKNFSNKMNVEVMAPTDLLHVYSNGKTVIGPNQFTNTGEWRLFRPSKPEGGG